VDPDWRGAPRFRPNVVGEPVAPQSQRGSPIRYLSLDTVLLPTNNVPFGSAGRNIARMPSFYQVDAAAVKDFRLPRESMALQFRAEIFNVTNKTNFATLQPNRNNAAFGRFLTTFDPRLVQFALRLTF